MAAHVFSNPCTAADVFFVAPLFDPGVAEGGVSASPGAAPSTVERVETFLEEAERQTARDLWGDSAGMAVCLMAAHLLHEDAVANAVLPNPSTPGGQGFAGPITSQSMGPITRSFGARAGAGFKPGGGAAFEDEPLATTPWGKRLIQLRPGFVGGIA